MKPVWPQMTYRRALAIAVRRLREQGLRTSLLWLYGRGLPAVTGVPILKFCRINDHLYIGSQPKQAGFDHLRSHGINGVVNMRIEADDRRYDMHDMDYCHLPVIDDAAPSPSQVSAGCHFIDTLISNGKRVYIHCGAGVGRAPTMAAAYRIWKGDSLQNTLNIIRQVRPFIFLTPPQMKFLRDFELEQLSNTDRLS